MSIVSSKLSLTLKDATKKYCNASGTTQHQRQISSAQLKLSKSNVQYKVSHSQIHNDDENHESQEN